MNLTLTMQFDTIDELKEFLNRAPGARNTPVAAVTSIDPAAVAAATVVNEVDPLDMGVPAVEEVVDLVAFKEELKGILAAKAGTMEEPKILGAFITGFGVQKFSDLPDDMLVPFKAAFLSEFGE